MRNFVVLMVMIFAAALSANAQTAMEKNLMAMEKSAWDSFGKGDGKFFQTFLADDSQVIGENGIMDKTASVAGINTKPCVLKSYEFGNFKVKMADPNTALVTYQATEDATCGGQAAPAKVYASSVYVKRGGKWMPIFHQETAAMAMK